MRSLLLSIGKKIGYAIAVVIIIAGLLVSIADILTPILDKHRTQVETWASSFLNVPVKIANIQVSWYRYQPVVTLNQVTLLNKDTQEAILQIKEVRIFFSILDSLWQWKGVPNGVMIVGSDLNLHEDNNGDISVQGFPSLGGYQQEPFHHETKFAEVLTWLSVQPRLILQDIDIRYTGFNRKKRYVTLYKLLLENAQDQHRILGKAILHQDIATELNLTIHWVGVKPELAKIKAKIYAYVTGFSISQWLQDFQWKGWRADHGIASAKIWAVWDNGKFHKIQSTFQLYQLNLYSAADQSTHFFPRISGNIGWKREGANQVFAGDDILIDLPSHFWPVTSFYTLLASDAKGELKPKAMNLGYVDINDVQSILFSMPSLLPASVKQTLSALHLRGDCQNAVMTFSGAWDDWKQISLNMNFSRLGFAAWQRWPGVKNLSGALRWNGTQGALSINSNQAQFEYHQLFNYPIKLEQISGELEWQQDAHQAWIFHMPSSRLLNRDMALNISGQFTLPEEGDPSIDMNANFVAPKADRISHYLPLQIFDPLLSKWLQQAFVAGEVQAGHAILQGKLSDFPFDKNNGQFLIQAELKNLNFHFAPDWPALQKSNGRIIFSGRQLKVDVDQAQLGNLTLKNIHGIIPYIGDAKPQVVQIQSDNIKTNFNEALRFIHMSPLEKTLGKMFARIDITGSLGVGLNLVVPLRNPEKTQVDGNLAINHAQLDAAAWGLTLNNLTGHFHFSEDAAHSKEMTGEIFGQPIQIDVSTVRPSKNNSFIQAHFALPLSIMDLEKWLKLPFSRVLAGAAPITGEADFSLTDPLQVHLHSKLKGVKVDLPDQYAKKAEELKDFSADIIIADKPPLRVKLNYNNQLSAAMLINGDAGRFNLTACTLWLGKGQADWPASAGLFITGEIDELNWDNIKQYTNQSSANMPSALTLKNVNVYAHRFKIFGRQLNDIRFEVTPSQTNWKININSPQMTGQLDVPVKLVPSSTISARFDELHLESSADSKDVPSSFDIKSLPMLSFSAKRVSFNDMDLGNVSFKTTPSGGGFDINDFNISSSDMDLRARGHWRQEHDQQSTHFHGEADSANVSDLLSRLRFRVPNFIASDGHVSFDLNWDKAPFAATLQVLQGHATFKIGHGRIIDIGQTGNAEMGLGRMLNLFSLQSIPRRLTFDFSDIFQKGYSFDVINGDLSIKEGNLYTTDTYFNGPVARVDIEGRIGIVDKDYDLRLSITPFVTSSLPVAAFLTGGPIIGLAALGVNTVISSSKVITYRYVVTGPWNDPSWESVSTFQKKSG